MWQKQWEDVRKWRSYQWCCNTLFAGRYIYKMSRVSRWEGHQKRIKSRLKEIWSGCWASSSTADGNKKERKKFFFYIYVSQAHNLSRFRKGSWNPVRRSWQTNNRSNYHHHHPTFLFPLLSFFWCVCVCDVIFLSTWKRRIGMFHLRSRLLARKFKFQFSNKKHNFWLLLLDCCCHRRMYHFHIDRSEIQYHPFFVMYSI